MNSEHITSQQTRLMQLEQAPHVYEARKRRVEWPDAVRLDHEVKALDEQHGEWILCRTCAEHYEKYEKIKSFDALSRAHSLSTAAVGIGRSEGASRTTRTDSRSK